MQKLIKITLSEYSDGGNMLIQKENKDGWKLISFNIRDYSNEAYLIFEKA